MQAAGLRVGSVGRRKPMAAGKPEDALAGGRAYGRLKNPVALCRSVGRRSQFTEGGNGYLLPAADAKNET